MPLPLAQILQSANFLDLLLTKIEPVIAQPSALPAHSPGNIKDCSSLLPDRVFVFFLKTFMVAPFEI